MSLYNMVKGFNPFAAVALAIVGVKMDLVARFRDAWLSDDGLTITILTRTGGNNREDYVADNLMLQSLPGFQRDHDDDFDSTFAHFLYTVPEAFRADTATIAGFLAEFGDGAANQGPKAMVDAVRREMKPPLPDLKPDDPRVVAATAAYNQLVIKLKSLQTTQ